MREVTVFVGGSVGSDPYSKKTWSGSCASLLTAMRAGDLLDRAVGIDLAPLRKRLLLLKNFNRDRAIWRQHFYADPAYRQQLTQAAGRTEVHSPVLLQLGSMFSLPNAFPAKKCISYHDGNLAERLKSGFNIEGISARRVEQALRYEETVSQQMTAVFTFSEYLRQSFIHDYHVPAERVFNVGGGINLTAMPEVDEAKDYRGQRLLFIGAEFARKGGPELLLAFAQVREVLPHAELHIAGPRQLRDVPPGVVFHGHLSKDDPAQAARLQTLFKQSDLFVLPSRYEPFGIAPLEAMLYRLPCIVTNGWALAETVVNGVNGALVQKGSVPDLVTKLLHLLNAPEEMAQMGRRGRDIVLERYTWPSVTKRMANIIATL